MAETNQELSLARHLGHYLVSWSKLPKAHPKAQLIAKIGQLLEQEINQKHTHLDLTSIAAEQDLGRPDEVLQLLEQAGLLSDTGFDAPLVADHNLLYLARYYRYETKLANALLQLAPQQLATEPSDFIAARLKTLFPDIKHEGRAVTNWQRVAAAMAMHKCLTLLLGGPGTGKTTTIGRLLLLLLEQNESLVIKLTAPTGSAAARLADAMKNAWQEAIKENLCDPALLQLLPHSAQTLHRLLGYRFVENTFRFGPKQPLNADLVIVDETSMVDLRMMTQLISALKPNARLLLAGDNHQLASVASGQVLGDICTGKQGHQKQSFRPQTSAFLQQMTGYECPSEPMTPLADCLCWLHHNHRSNQTISHFAAVVNKGDSQAAIDLFDDNTLQWHQQISATDLVQAITDIYATIYAQLKTLQDPQQMLEMLSRFRLLCGTRHGLKGNLTMSAKIEAALRQRKLIGQHDFYHGKLIMVTTNSYHLNLFNGDTGVILTSPEGERQAWFTGTANQPRCLHIKRLPSHELALAMTIHKSQGLEFDQVGIVLPDKLEGHLQNLLTKEMIYTGITRARQAVTVYARPEVLKSAIENRTIKRSGLRRRLWQ